VENDLWIHAGYSGYCFDPSLGMSGKDAGEEGPLSLGKETHVNYKSGFIAIVGAPNVGKSTLMNRILGEKISITSRKPQTTRNRILGVLHHSGYQMVFMDTPGVHRASKPLNVRIVDVAVSALGEADMILFMTDLSEPDPISEAIVMKKLSAQNHPVVLALNKSDLVDNETVLKEITRLSGLYNFSEIVPVSARHGLQVDDLLAAMEKILPEGPPFFPEDALTDMPERFIAGEIIREKVFRLTGDEIPYAVAVTVDSFKEEKGGKLIKINATVHVERKSQKGIIIGKRGAKLKQIGQSAREDIQRMVGSRVFLKLFVRVQKNWSRDTRALRRFGY